MIYSFDIVITVHVFRDLFTLVANVFLNIVSFMQISNFLRKREIIFNFDHASTSSELTGYSESTQKSTHTNAHSKNIRKLNAQFKLLCMVCILCVIAIVSRIILIVCDMSYFIKYEINVTVFIDLVLVLHPTVSFFIYYNFNCIFKKEFLIIFEYFR